MILDNLRDIVRAASANHGGVVAAQRWATRSIGAAILDAYTLAADRGEGLACYRLCCQAVRQVCGEPELQSLFASHRNILRRFLAELDMPEHDPAVVVREWLFRSMWRDVWTSKLAYLREADRRRILQVRGLAALPQDWRSQGIIFAHWHAMFTESVWAWLAIEDIDPGIIIGRARWDLTLYEQNDPTTITLQSVIDLRRAQDALGHGRHVHILADGMSGLRGMELEWFGGRWEFQPGFAHLALRSGAPVHPISVHLQDDGGIDIVIAPALAQSRMLPGARAVLTDMVGRYVDFLAGRWRDRPAEVNLSHMERFVLRRHPRSDESRPDSFSQAEIALCVGLPGSGSTWIFNVVGDIWRDLAVPGAVKSFYFDADTPLDWFEARHVVVKTHLFSMNLLGLNARVAAYIRARVIVSIRDPMDAVVSLMQRFAMKFADALLQVADSARGILQLARTTGVTLFRYEDGFIGTPESFDRIATSIGAAPRPGLCEDILRRLSAASVSATIARFVTEGRIDQTRAWDPQTHWHLNHVGDGRVGKYRETLSEARQSLVAWRTAAFARHFGYAASHDFGAPPEFVVLTDVGFWDGETLFALWLLQCLQTLAGVLPVRVLYMVAAETVTGASPAWLEVVRVGQGNDAIVAGLRDRVLSGTAIACAEAAADRAAWLACAAVPATRATPRLHFSARGGDVPHLTIALGEADPVRYRMGTLRNLPADTARCTVHNLDRSQLLVVVASPASTWDELALHCLAAAARARGMTLHLVACAADAAHSPAFLGELLRELVHPVLLIGVDATVWTFCRYLLQSAGTPHLYLGPACIMPLERTAHGMPSLSRSIARFLDAASTPPAYPVPDPAPDDILDVLVPA